MTIAGPSRSWTRPADGDTLATRVRCSYPTELPTHPCARRRPRGEGIGRLAAVTGADVDALRSRSLMGRPTPDVYVRTSAVWQHCSQDGVASVNELPGFADTGVN